MIAAYPLQWPTGWKRAFQRINGKFAKTERTSSQHGSWNRKRDLTVADGVDRVLLELERFGIDRQDIVISTNVRTRLDGLPRSGEREPDDPGAAVYWTDWRDTSKPKVMAIDQYTTVADNLAAIAATLEAMRAIERHGGALIMERAFTGFTALPAPGAPRDWQVVLGLQDLLLPTLADVKAAYRRLASERHPDKGGTDTAMAELNAAYGEAQKEIGQ